MDIGEAEWWLDEAALPGLIWARLSRGLDGWFVDDCDGARALFESREAAETFLGEEGYARLAELITDGEVSACTTPPKHRWPP